MARMVLDDETKLEQDAAIYSKRTEESEKEIRKNLTKEQKVQYFKDYYLPKILVGVLVAALLIWLGKDFFAPKKDVVLYVAVVDDVLSNAAVEELRKDLEELYAVDTDRQEIVVNAGFSSSSLDSMGQLTTFIYAGEVDVIISSEKEFTILAESGHFAEYDKETATKIYADYEEDRRVYVVPKAAEGEEEDTDKEAVNCGIDLEGGRRLKELGSIAAKSYAGIVINSQNQENAARFIAYMADR